jgi:hypothetical protein
MNLTERVNAFVQLGNELEKVLSGKAATEAGKKLTQLIPEMHHRNGWFTENNIRHRLENLAAGLKKEVLEDWLKAYKIMNESPMKKIGVILAGNIPMVGFDDFRSVLITGNIFTGKLSSDDKLLLPLIGEMLVEKEPRFDEQVVFTEGQLKGMDAIIATGSNNSARYFEHYFGKYPHIIRGNRNGVAVLSGNETQEELKALGEDIFRYFGLGCRNVTKLFVPENYSFNLFFEAIFDRGEEMLSNSKYMNNYDYHKTLYLLSSFPLLDNNFLLLKEDKGISSPPGVVFYETYSDLSSLQKKLREDEAKIQCVIARTDTVENAIAFGHSQLTRPSDYADGVDVLKFLLDIV